MMYGLTPKQALFVKGLSKGHTQTSAAILAGYSPKSAYSTSSRMMRNDKIVKALDRVGLTDKRIAEGIKNNAFAGEGVKATADTSIRAFELATRLKGYLGKDEETPNLFQTNIYFQQLNQMSDEELNAELNKLTIRVAQFKRK